ncbi:MAG: hypothetical protein JXB30_05985 [Anaerolineae bacterium]|nr:hypothetical protein [Anaerolineae bacterium]
MSQQFPPEEQVTRQHHPGTMPQRSSVKTQQYRTPSPDYDDVPDPGSSSLYVPWWGFALVILIVAGLTCGLWGVVLLSRGSAADGPTPTPIFVVIVPTPTLGPLSEGTVPPESLPTPTPEEIAATEPTADTNLSVAIEIGSMIVIDGTGGDGLAVRQGPGLDYQYIFVANDGDQFEVQDGPREANDYTWWYIVDPQNPDRFGWAVVDFMQVVQ